MAPLNSKESGDVTLQTKRNKPEVRMNENMRTCPHGRTLAGEWAEQPQIRGGANRWHKLSSKTCHRWWELVAKQTTQVSNGHQTGTETPTKSTQRRGSWPCMLNILCHWEPADLNKETAVQNCQVWIWRASRTTGVCALGEDTGQSSYSGTQTDSFLQNWKSFLYNLAAPSWSCWERSSTENPGRKCQKPALITTAQM